MRCLEIFDDTSKSDLVAVGGFPAEKNYCGTSPRANGECSVRGQLWYGTEILLKLFFLLNSAHMLVGNSHTLAVLHTQQQLCEVSNSPPKAVSQPDQLSFLFFC